MSRIKGAFGVLLVLLTILWLMADTLWPEPFTYFSFRSVFIQYSGVIGIAVMSVAMLLALRPKWVEPRLDGLNKMYRLHKWLGITGLVFAVLHWWFAKGTKWMVGWGWLERPVRHRGGSGQTYGLIEGWLRDQRGFAETVGEWAFYILAALLVLALVRRLPYHLFTKTHKWLAVIYLLLVYHSVVLARLDYWSQPIGWLLAVLLISGSIAALWVLAGRVGSGRKVQGQIDDLIYYPDLRVLETAITLKPGWPGHAAGQFDFEDTPPRQIWVGAGIGITPFIARLKQLVATPGPKDIDLFHPTADFEQAAIDKLTADAEAAGVRLHVLAGHRKGRLDGEAIRSVVPDWQSASIWFCGPPGFGQSLRDDFVAHGLASKHFHQELFQLR